MLGNNINSLWIIDFCIYRLDISLKGCVSSMGEIAKAIGQRIRNYRTKAGFSQEKLAELSGCHPTYIGQLERGEKNATIESIDKIATALNVPMSTLFEQLGGQNHGSRNIPLECYEFLSAKTPDEQDQLFKILLEMDKYKSK